MKKGEKLYEGKAKILYKTDSDNLLIAHFKDDTTAFDGAKKEVLEDKGVINCAISTAVFEYLEKHGIRPTLLKGCLRGKCSSKSVKSFRLRS